MWSRRYSIEKSVSFVHNEVLRAKCVIGSVYRGTNREECRCRCDAL